MKNIVILSSLIAAIFVLTSCSSYCTAPCSKAAAPCAVKPDLKGEVEK